MPQPSYELRSFQAPVMMFYRSNEEDETAPSLHHYHEGYEIYYLFNGYRAMAVESKEYMLRPGDLLLLPPGLGHQSWAVEDMPQNHVVVNVETDFLEQLLKQADVPEMPQLLNGKERVLRLPSNQQFVLDSLLYELQQELTTAQPGAPCAMRARLTLMLVFLLRNLSCEITHMSQSGHKRKNDIEQVASFIEEHYADPVTLGGMAKIFMTNPCALSRSFKRYMGVPPISYLNRVRIQAAKELIENSDLSLTQVCSRVGYESLTYFGRVFKEFTGVTPSQFRRQVRSRAGDRREVL